MGRQIPPLQCINALSQPYIRTFAQKGPSPKFAIFRLILYQNRQNWTFYEMKRAFEYIKYQRKQLFIVYLDFTVCTVCKLSWTPAENIWGTYALLLSLHLKSAVTLSKTYGARPILAVGENFQT